jgi:hypothetical protein
MLDRFRQRSSPISAKHDQETIINDRCSKKAELLFSFSRPAGTHLVVDDEELDSEDEPGPGTNQPLAPTITQLTSRPDSSAS